MLHTCYKLHPISKFHSLWRLNFTCSKWMISSPWTIMILFRRMQFAASRAKTKNHGENVKFTSHFSIKIIMSCKPILKMIFDPFLFFRHSVNINFKANMKKTKIYNVLFCVCQEKQSDMLFFFTRWLLGMAVCMILRWISLLRQVWEKWANKKRKGLGFLEKTKNMQIGYGIEKSSCCWRAQRRNVSSFEIEF